MLDRFEELAGDLNHPEGVAWNPVDGRVYAGGEGGELYAVTLDGEVEELAATGGSMLGIAVDERGRVYACDAGVGSIVRLDPATGAVETYGQGPAASRLDTPNVVAFGPDGMLYVTCSGEDGRPDQADCPGRRGHDVVDGRPRVPERVPRYARRGRARRGRGARAAGRQRPDPAWRRRRHAPGRR
ncbi:MAG: SMP-30/gluconolactonase/LRE family protein [Actinomycetota bacterium]